MNKNTIKSFKIKNDFYVNEIAVAMPEKATTLKVPEHQFIIIDRSGSMWNAIDSVCDTIIKYTDSLVEGSTVSIGWFSGDSQYGLSVPFMLKKEHDGVVKTVDSYRDTLGCTNFTEILSKVNQSCQGQHSSLYFFTDGYHNCGSFSKVIAELNQLRDKLNVALFVGCGWINRDNMTEMAQVANGSFIQLSNFSEFEQSLYDFGDGVTESVPGCLVDVSSDMTNICSILGKQIISYDVKDGQIAYKASNKKKQCIYCTSAKPLGEITQPGKNEVPFRAMAYYLVQHNQTTLAIDILDYLGDKHIINKLYNCFTLDEYAKAETLIRSSIFNTKQRYKEGQYYGYIVKDDTAFCVLDALDILTADDNATLCLNDKEFKYNAISRPTTQTDGAPLIYPKEINAAANNLVYNETALNVSLQCNYKAKVELDPKQFKNTLAKDVDFKHYGLKKGSKQEVNCIRNYSIIANAKLNTPKLILSKLSKSTVKKLGEHLSLRDDGNYVLDLDKLPLINRSYLKETSGKKLAENCWKSRELGTELSVLRHLIKLKTPQTKALLDNSDLKEMLETCFYIKNGMYQPPKSQIEATDEYLRYEFLVSFKGFSKTTASAIIKKIDEGKTVTEREIPTKLAYDKYKNHTLEELEYAFKLVSKEYKALNNKIQHAKFAIILINRGQMNEFNSRENMQLELNEKIDTNDVKVITQFEVVQKPVKI